MGRIAPTRREAQGRRGVLAHRRILGICDDTQHRTGGSAHLCSANGSWGLVRTEWLDVSEAHSTAPGAVPIGERPSPLSSSFWKGTPKRPGVSAGGGLKATFIALFWLTEWAVCGLLLAPTPFLLLVLTAPGLCSGRAPILSPYGLGGTDPIPSSRTGAGGLKAIRVTGCKVGCEIKQLPRPGDISWAFC